MNAQPRSAVNVEFDAAAKHSVAVRIQPLVHLIIRNWTGRKPSNSPWQTLIDRSAEYSCSFLSWSAAPQICLMHWRPAYLRSERLNTAHAVCPCAFLVHRRWWIFCIVYNAEDLSKCVPPSKLYCCRLYSEPLDFEYDEWASGQPLTVSVTRTLFKPASCLT